MKPFFSIVVPLYNKAAYVTRALESIAGQLFSDYEVIVVNDGSTDGSSERVKTFIAEKGEKFPIRLHNQDNQGAAAARNQGIAMATGEYVTFLDADDWWEPVFLKEMKGLIARYPDAGVYGTNYYITKNRRTRVAPVGVPEGFTEGTINYCQVYAKTICMPFNSDTVTIKREILESFGGFRPMLKLGEDFDLWIRLVLQYPVAYLNKPLATYCQDVAPEFRALGHLHDPEQHMLWNLDYLGEEEARNADLKQLLDNLRTYGLFPYYLSRRYRKAAQQQLDKVDWTRQSSSTRRLYGMPVAILQIRQCVLTIGSKLKQSTLHFFNRLLRSFGPPPLT